MSYQVLARKWRPKSFEQLVGQEHVLRALINALDSQRIHHAFLFTGTRGVGKTTIARIFAKSLNCEQGISSTPCGECSTCTEIDAGHYVDLIEVDGASRTKVEDTRELLDNVQYAPTRGLYKVYLIDEVHMLSTHSFNALLKTLEEPPPHVKFLLATTDPQKLPITILSRCLQFNLRRIPIQQIDNYLQNLLEQESIKFETKAVYNISKAADGSMRDALSVLDQAISFGNGELLEKDINIMLGNIEQIHVFLIIDALMKNSASMMMDCVTQLYQHAVDFSKFLSEILTCLHNIALIQKVPAAYDELMGDRLTLDKFAGLISAEDIQLYYQIGLIGQRDLALAPNPKVGFEMVLLRMLAFRPESVKKKQPKIVVSETQTNTAPVNQPIVKNPVNNDMARTEKMVSKSVLTNQEIVQNPWDSVVASLSVTGLDKQLIMNCVYISNTDKYFELALAPINSSLLTKERKKNIESLVSDIKGEKIEINIKIEKTCGESLTEKNIRLQELTQIQAAESIKNDKNVQDIIDTFSASINNKSVKPI